MQQKSQRQSLKVKSPEEHMLTLLNQIVNMKPESESLLQKEAAGRADSRSVKPFSGRNGNVKTRTLEDAVMKNNNIRYISLWI